MYLKAKIDFQLRPDKLVKKIARKIVRAIRVKTFTKPKKIKINFNGLSFFMVVDPKNGYVDKIIYINRFWDRKISDVLVKILHPGSVFIDVGANIGFFTLLSACLVGSKGKVFAFEPLKRCRKQIQQSISLNHKINNILLLPFACGEVKRKDTIFLREENIGGSSLLENIGANEQIKFTSEEIDVVMLDEELKSESRIDVIKVDVEGFEPSVLMGAQKILNQHRPILVIEFTPFFYERIRGGLTQDFVTFLKYNKYNCFDLDGRVIDLEKETLDLLRLREQTDLVCFPMENKIAEKILTEELL